MKKHYLKGTILGLLLFSMPALFAQQTIKNVDELKLKDAGQTLSTWSNLGYSPDLGGSCDGAHCTAHELTEHWLEASGMEEEYRAQERADAIMASEMLGGARATYTLPVIFHVVHNLDNPAENVSTADIYALLDEVNLDFSATNPDVGDARSAYGFTPADADIEFCLAAYDPWGNPLDEYGIERVETTEDYYDVDTEANKMKGSTGGDTGTEGWDRNQYINIWICDITNGATFGTAGYAYKPTTTSLPPASIDGIVIDYNIGMDNDVLTHELGHFLGLSHTWGNSNTETDCVEDDGLADTPQTMGPSFNYSGSCSGFQEVCPSTQTQYENFMDYSSCQVMFTTDQANLMSAVLEGSRAPLTSSAVCTPLFPTPPVADFVADITTTIEGGSVNFTDLSTEWPTSWSWTVTPSTGVSFIGGTSATDQNPTIQFDNAGFYTVALTASNGSGSDTETKTDYIEVVASGGGAIACDTNRNYTAAEEDNLAIYTLTGEAGYYPSLATISGAMLVSYADSYNAPTPTNVRRVRFPVLQVDDIGAASNVTFTVWNDVGGLPGAVLGTETVALTDLNEGFYNEVTFDPEVGVAGDYWVGWQLDASSFDTLLMATTNFTDRPAGTSSSATFVSAPFSAWYLTSDLFTSGPDASLILDVLTSNGPAPVANVSFPITETCVGVDVTMNGFGSLNADSYYWDIYHVTDDESYFFDEANLTTTFLEGDWEISLIVDGSCMSDESATFDLTINPALTGPITVTDEICVAADGEIDFSGVSGGSGTGYQYSINDGASFSGSPVFGGLVTGDYDYIITDDANCELTGTVTVENDNSFAPTITPDMTILAGTSTDLTVTGGTTWLWYEGAIEVGTTSTITVAPTVTTTYYCNVFDGSGCEAELEVTITVDDDSGLDGIGLENGITIYPNPTNGLFGLVFDLNKEADLNIEILNVLGDKVMRQQLNSVKDQTVKFDMSEMASGVYFVVIETENETISKKMVIRR